jgi:hypothetical protein
MQQRSARKRPGELVFLAGPGDEGIRFGVDVLKPRRRV